MSQVVDISEIKTEGIVDSLNHPLASYLRDFLIREKRLTSNEIIIDDIENIEEALKAGATFKKLFVSGLNLEIPKSFLEKLSGVPIYEVAPRTCKKIFEKEKSSRIFAIAEMPKTTVLSKQLMQVQGDVIVLDGVNISGNIGAIIRTSVALNAGGIIVLNAHIADIYDRRVIRASRGYIFKIPVVTATLLEFLQFCQTNQFKLLATSAQAKETIDEIAERPEKMAIILGAEKTGCSDELSKRADFHAKIPMNPAVESLNVSVAASIILYMRNKQRL